MEAPNQDIDIETNEFEDRRPSYDSDGYNDVPQTFEAAGEKLRHDLEFAHHEPQSLSSVLAAPAISLEHKMAADKLAREFRTNESRASHRRSSGLSSVLAAPAHELEKNIIHDKLAHSLSEPRTSGLEMSGNQNVSSLLRGTSQQLEKQFKVDALNHSLKPHKRTSDLETQMAHSLAAQAKELEKSLKSDEISRRLTRRSSQEDLMDRGLLPAGNVAPLLAAPAIKLERSFVADKVNVAQRAQSYLRQEGNVKEEVEKAVDDTLPTTSLKERLEAYNAATGKTKAEPKSEPVGLSLKERMAQYLGSTSSSPPKDSHVETKPETPSSTGSIKDRMSAFIHKKDESPKSVEKEVPASGMSLKERLAAYTTNATAKVVKKQVDMDEEKKIVE